MSTVAALDLGTLTEGQLLDRANEAESRNDNAAFQKAIDALLAIQDETTSKVKPLWAYPLPQSKKTYGRRSIAGDGFYAEQDNWHREYINPPGIWAIVAPDPETIETKTRGQRLQERWGKEARRKRIIELVNKTRLSKPDRKFLAECDDSLLITFSLYQKVSKIKSVWHIVGKQKHKHGVSYFEDDHRLKWDETGLKTGLQVYTLEELKSFPVSETLDTGIAWELACLNWKDNIKKDFVFTDVVAKHVDALRNRANRARKKEKDTGLCYFANKASQSEAERQYFRLTAQREPHQLVSEIKNERKAKQVQALAAEPEIIRSNDPFGHEAFVSNEVIDLNGTFLADKYASQSLWGDTYLTKAGGRWESHDTNADEYPYGNEAEDKYSAVATHHGLDQDSNSLDRAFGQEFDPRELENDFKTPFPRRKTEWKPTTEKERKEKKTPDRVPWSETYVKLRAAWNTFGPAWKEVCKELRKEDAAEREHWSCVVDQCQCLSLYPASVLSLHYK
jgi:hypothetical protein